MRCYGLTSPRHDGKLSVNLCDIDNYYSEWDIESLPWDAVTPVPVGASHTELDEVLVEAIQSRAIPIDTPAHARAAATAFLYMYMVLAHEDEHPSFNFTARSTLPIGAGLGSSASYSACAASALLLLHQRIQLPSLPEPSRAPHPESGDIGHIHVSHKGRRAVPKPIAEEVNQWAFISEKILHGNPSGVDNSVAVFGGALAYVRGGFGRPAGMEAING